MYEASGVFKSGKVGRESELATKIAFNLKLVVTGSFELRVVLIIRT